jgi:hypothetical protein
VPHMSSLIIAPFASIYRTNQNRDNVNVRHGPCAVGRGKTYGSGRLVGSGTASVCLKHASGSARHLLLGASEVKAFANRFKVSSSDSSLLLYTMEIFLVGVFSM